VSKIERRIKKHPLERLVYLVKRRPQYEIGDANPSRDDLDIVQRKVPPIVDPVSQTKWFESRYKDMRHVPFTDPFYYEDVSPKYPGDRGREIFPRTKNWIDLLGGKTVRENIRRAARLLREAARELEEMGNPRKAGLYRKAEDIDEWLKAGFTPEEAKRWAFDVFQFTPEEAARWRDIAGFSEPLEAWLWKVVGSPEEVRAWLDAGFEYFVEALEWIHSGVRDPEEAARRRDRGEFPTMEKWLEVGFTLEEAREWYEVGFTPNESILWKKRGFSAVEADKWLKHGIECPVRAAKWRDMIGISDPGEVVEWRRAGVYFAETAKEWIDAGFGPKEAKRWIDAGFEPEEAKQWLEAGVTDPEEARIRRNRGETPTKTSSRRYSLRRRYFRR